MTSKLARITVLAIYCAALAILASAPAGASADNGIHVSEPKLFDARALFLRLDELNARLGRLDVVDQQKLAAALGTFQGRRVRETQFGLEATGPSSPQVVATRGLDAETDELVTQSEQVTTAAATPTVPTLPTPPGSISTDLPVGLSAQDLLSDQVNLTYQIYSLRLLLERALSDRLLPADTEAEPRQQAILGFQVNLDPPRRAKKHAAFVEVTVVPKKNGETCLERPSVVALMPQEKTYNASTVSTKLGSFGGAALAGVFSLGVNVRKSNQVFYVYRDSDTTSFPRLEPADGLGDSAATFGWQFRPVLGRKSVSPEPRQLMAVLALPESDVGAEAGALELEVHVRTFWRKVHSGSETVRRDRVMEEGPDFLHSVAAWKSGFSEKSLKPQIEAVNWTVVGADKALVTVRGQNFFPGTEVLLGGTRIDPSSGLVIKSDQTLEFETSLTALANEDGMLSGRFGPSVGLEGEASGGSGIRFYSLTRDRLQGRGLVKLSLELQEREGKDLELDAGLQPLIAVGGQPLPGPYDVLQFECARDEEVESLWGIKCVVDDDGRTICTPVRARSCLRIETSVPTSLLTKDTQVSVRVPLRGRRWYASRVLEYEPTTITMERIGGTEEVRFALNSWGVFDRNWRVVLDQEVPVGQPNGDARLDFVNEGMMLLTVKSGLLGKYPKIGVRAPNDGPLFLVSVPGYKAPVSKAELEPKKQVREVKKNHAVAVEYTGANLTKVEEVVFGDKELKFSAQTKRITVFLTRDVTKEVGEVDLLLKAKDNVDLVVSVRVTT